MFPNIRNVLSLNSTVNSLVDGRIYRHGEAPQDINKPYITWFISDGMPENTLSCSPDIDKMSIQIDMYHVTDSGLVDLSKAVRNVIEQHAYIVGMPVNERDEKTRLFRFVFMVDWLLERE